MEFLDKSDSQYLAGYLKKRRWQEITPPAHEGGTFYNNRPDDGDLKAFRETEPDWYYLSGHYARTFGKGAEGSRTQPLPTGFFNEPFHVAEWESEWNESEPRSLFLQAETLRGVDTRAFEDYFQRRWLRSPYGPRAHKSTAADETDKDKVIQAWTDIWSKPAEDVLLGGAFRPGIRGLLFEQKWTSVKVLMLVGCNTLTWPKTLFREAFPNALVLGYVNKNPANGTPHIRAFLKNAFSGIGDPRDPRLMNHEHLANAWMDVYRRQRLTKSARMAYMTTAGKVFAWDRKRNIVEMGSAEQITFRPDGDEFMVENNFFGN
jgi:hypothetical protein